MNHSIGTYTGFNKSKEICYFLKNFAFSFVSRKRIIANIINMQKSITINE